MAMVDVLLPVRNGANYVAAAIESIQAQTFADWRLLILDHGSADESINIAESYASADPRIAVFSFPEASGLSGLLNKGLELCDCRYVLRHDADDIAFPDRIEISLSAFENNRSFIAIGGQAELIDQYDRRIGSFQRPTDPARISAGCFFWNPMTHPTVMIDFPQLRELGAWYGVDFLRAVDPSKSIAVDHLAEDYFLFGQLALLGKCANLPCALIKYRQHSSNVSSTRFREQMELSLRISRFLMRSLSERHKVPYVDPAPFCNHGGALFAFRGRSDFTKEFEDLAAAMRTALDPSEGLDRELAYRKTISTRATDQLLIRHFSFSLLNETEKDERNAIREWAIGKLRGRKRMTIDLESR